MEFPMWAGISLNEGKVFGVIVGQDTLFGREVIIVESQEARGHTVRYLFVSDLRCIMEMKEAEITALISSKCSCPACLAEDAEPVNFGFCDDDDCIDKAIDESGYCEAHKPKE